MSWQNEVGVRDDGCYGAALCISKSSIPAVERNANYIYKCVSSKSEIVHIIHSRLHEQNFFPFFLKTTSTYTTHVCIHYWVMSPNTVEPECLNGNSHFGRQFRWFTRQFKNSNDNLTMIRFQELKDVLKYEIRLE